MKVDLQDPHTTAVLATEYAFSAQRRYESRTYRFGDAAEKLADYAEARMAFVESTQAQAAHMRATGCEERAEVIEERAAERVGAMQGPYRYMQLMVVKPGWETAHMAQVAE